MARQAPTLAQCLIDDPLQLSVGGAKLVGRPFLHGIHHLGIHAENEIFCHAEKLMVQRASVQHGLCILVGTEHHEQIAHHGGFLLLV